MVNNVAVLCKFRKRKDEVPPGTTLEDYLHHECDFKVTLDMFFKRSSEVIDAGKQVETANCQIDMVADAREALYDRFLDLVGEARMSIRMASTMELNSLLCECIRIGQEHPFFEASDPSGAEAR
jgi:hypothetical protein